MASFIVHGECDSRLFVHFSRVVWCTCSTICIQCRLYSLSLRIVCVGQPQHTCITNAGAVTVDDSITAHNVNKHKVASCSQKHFCSMTLIRSTAAARRHQAQNFGVDEIDTKLSRILIHHPPSTVILCR